MQIFISYSRENREQAEILAQDLKDLGHSVWLDQALTGGQTWWEQILATVIKADVFIFVLSLEALRSTACRREWNYANQLHKRILPVLVSDVSTNLIPPELSKLQFVDYRRTDKQAALALNKALQNLPPPMPLPDPLPLPPEVPVSYLSNLRDQIEGKLPSDFGFQIALVLKLKDHLKNKDEYEDTRKLLEELRRHEDLLAKVANEIDALMEDTTFATSEQIQYAEARESSEATSNLPGPKVSAVSNFKAETIVHTKETKSPSVFRIIIAAVVGLSGCSCILLALSTGDLTALVLSIFFGFIFFAGASLIWRNR